MRIVWYRFLDYLGSLWHRNLKAYHASRQWGPDWINCVRPGRTYTRVVERSIEIGSGYIFEHAIRPEPGWEWTCPNCKEYSFITEAMMPGIISAWEKTAQQMTALAAAKGVTYKIPERPTIERALCTNCRFRPGPPE